VGITYFDHASGRNRVKRRYVWAVWGYALGICTVLLVKALL